MALLQTGEGSGGPAGTYTVTGTKPGILIQGANKVVDAQTVYAQENVYGVSYAFTIPKTEFMGVGPQASAGLYAGYIQAIGAVSYVQAVGYAQDTDAGSNLVDVLIVTVGTLAQDFQTEVTIPLLGANTPAVFGQLQTAYDALVAIAGHA